MTTTPHVYIAGPMTGYPEYNYPAFTEAAAALRANGRTVTSPHELHDNDFSRPFDWYLRRDLAALLTCTDIVLLPGWEASRGAHLELDVAIGLGMPQHLYLGDGQTRTVAYPA
jgi:nucleoside 2-deoxyribosyltransferase